MRMCEKHHRKCADSIKRYGLEDLVSKDGRDLERRLAGLAGDEAALETDTELEGLGPDPKNFDPLWSLILHFTYNALECGGPEMMERDATENDGYHCPLCEFEKNMPGFVCESSLDRITAQIHAWCKENRLILVN